MKLVGQGVSSCVLYPPYPCDGDNTKIRKNMVGKVMRDDKASDEEKRYQIVHSLDPKRIFSPKKVFRCKIGKHTKSLLSKLNTLECNTFKGKQVDKLEQIIMTNHGIPLYTYSFDKFNNVKYYIREIKRLLYCVSVLRKNRLSHMDLHTGNILVDPKTGKCTVIDFGELTRDKDVYSYVQRRVFTKKDYVQFPPELIILSVIISHKNREDIGRVIETLDTKLVSMLKQGASSGRLSGEIVREFSSRSKYHKIIGDLLNPEDFPEISRENLFSLRCKALLTLRDTIRVYKSFAYACAMSFVTIDSYAIGLILQKISQKIVMNNLDIVKTNEFQTVQGIIKRMTSSYIQERISSKQALDIIIDLNKP
jgi:serine/threonine protein kinase